MVSLHMSVLCAGLVETSLNLASGNAAASASAMSDNAVDLSDLSPLELEDYYDNQADEVAAANQQQRDIVSRQNL